MPLFRGATAVRNAIADYLDASVPKFVDLARSEWSLLDWQLPYPQVIRKYERALTSPYPSIDISVDLTDNYVVSDYDDAMAEQFQVRYDIVIVTVVTTPVDEGGDVEVIDNNVEDTDDRSDYAAAMRLRDDMAAVVRACLFDRQSLGQPDAFQLQLETFSETFSDAQKTAQRGVYAGGVAHRFKLRVDESMIRTPLGTADVINVITEPLSKGVS